jgi:mercuric ion transport protein
MTGLRIDQGGTPAADWRSVGLLGGAASMFGSGAVFISSCCVVPLSLAALGATGAVTGWIDTFAPYQPYFLGLTGLALGGGWLRFLRQHRTCCAADGSCSAPAARRRNAIVLSVATVIAILAFGREYIEPIVAGSLFGAA